MSRTSGVAAISATMLAAGLLVALAGGTRSHVAAQSPGSAGARDGDWVYYGGDVRNWRYKPFDQINASNFSKLEVAWRFRTDNMGPNLDYRLGATPIMANGVVYVVGGGMRRSVVALNASTGEMLWVHNDPSEGRRAEFAPRVGAGRGVSYWTDGKEERIIFVTTGYRLKALNAKTGALVSRLRQERRRRSESRTSIRISAGSPAAAWTRLTMADIGLHASSAIANDTIIVGAAGREGTTPFTTNEVKGYVRAFDVRTGRRLWTFHTIPQRGEFGADTWFENSAAANGSRRVSGRKSRSTPNSGWSTCRSRRRPTTTTAVTDPATISSPKASSPSTQDRSAQVALPDRSPSAVGS